MLDIITWTPRCTDLSLARSTRLSVITINAFDREKDPADHNASAVQSAPTNVDRRALRANSIETTEYFVSSFTLQPPHDAELSGYTYLASKTTAFCASASSSSIYEAGTCHIWKCRGDKPEEALITAAALRNTCNSVLACLS